MQTICGFGQPKISCDSVKSNLSGVLRPTFLPKRNAYTVDQSGDGTKLRHSISAQRTRDRRAAHRRLLSDIHLLGSQGDIEKFCKKSLIAIKKFAFRPAKFSRSCARCLKIQQSRDGVVRPAAKTTVYGACFDRLNLAGPSYRVLKNSARP